MELCERCKVAFQNGRCPMCKIHQSNQKKYKDRRRPYIRSKRLQFYKKDEPQHKLDVMHPSNYIDSCKDLTVRCGRCGELPKTIGEGIHFSFYVFALCNDCYALEPHDYGTENNFSYLFMDNEVKRRTGKIESITLAERFKREEEELDEDEK